MFVMTHHGASSWMLAEYKVRPRKVAMSTSKVMLARALANMHKRIAAIYKEKGRHIKID